MRSILKWGGLTEQEKLLIKAWRSALRQRKNRWAHWDFEREMEKLLGNVLRAQVEAKFDEKKKQAVEQCLDTVLERVTKEIVQKYSGQHFEEQMKLMIEGRISDHMRFLLDKKDAYTR